MAPVNVTGVVNAPGHTDWFGTAFTVGVGLTVIVNETGVPVQVVPPFVYVGVTVIVPVIGTKVPLVEVKEISPGTACTKSDIYICIGPVVNGTTHCTGKDGCSYCTCTNRLVCLGIYSWGWINRDRK